MKTSFGEIDFLELFERVSRTHPSSNLGFFSKPFRQKNSDQTFIVKLYHPTKNKLETIEYHHDTYIDELREHGIKIPLTSIYSVNYKEGVKICILQKAFAEQELVRNIIMNAELDLLKTIMEDMLDQTINFWIKKSKNSNLGFHPTLRNYALVDKELIYFDTFPPMNMPQDQLNKLMLKMAPVSNIFKRIVPTKMLNKVSDEYYQIDKMVVGLVGSTIRLRPVWATEILDLSIQTINRSRLDQQSKTQIIKRLSRPPRLGIIWRLVRKLTGNVGAKNV